MPTHWYQGKVIEIIQLNQSTRQFNLKVENDAGIFSFIPGQFVTMDLPVGEKRLQRWRSYSIANRPDKSNILEFCIVKSAGGVGTFYLFEEVKIGSIIKFKGPEGNFVIPKDLSDEIIMICTGTGIAPFRSMLQHIQHTKSTFHKIHLIFGTQNSAGILYRNEFEKFASENNNFSYSTALSKEIKNGFYHGHIHQVYMSQYATINKNRKFYICGWSGMIDEAVLNLSKLGYDTTQIHYELYG